MEQDAFETLYPVIRELYDELVYKQGNNPMQVFGVFMGIIGQEFRENSTKEDFDNFLTSIINLPWEERTVN